MKREEKSENSKERIIKAALEEFGQNGYVAASTNNMCKNHDISKGLLFHHYKNKDELFLVCVSKCFEALAQYLKENLPENVEDAKEGLNKYFEARFEFFKANPFYEQIFYTAVINTPSHLKDAVAERREAINAFNRHYLTKLLDYVVLKGDYEKSAIIELLGEMSHYIHMKYKGSCLENPEEKHQIVMQHSKDIKDMILILFYGIVK
ncbi:TetR/AcrR family transcriptional regulator [Zhenhengia yiwuensis]|uniref:TetR/AcrR family transcriptional regulator n=1 Tax=Zhenhengia yiwuensis TaxID=2763666 RepID=UPI002A757059|nr:TetR/AcrR family transcriptional regulator [Zhenhengia yiwuensis]MDY3367946.1 TetR/AcrR family transcriptional regulator [Zhenhengia yiwuensis]